MLLSILIPTLERRRPSFERLRAALDAQIRARGASDRVEILAACDGGRVPTGTKRNGLVARARGEFVASVDDDDAVNDAYIPSLLAAIEGSPRADCVGIVGEVRFRGGHTRRFVSSRRNTEYRTEGGVILMPPNHLNPIRREIALRYPFEDVWRDEDSDWAMRISRDGAIREEAFVGEPLYVYNSRRLWAYQRLVEATEFVRHPLGIRLQHRTRVRRWVRKTVLRKEGRP
jgi:hypothetical protein